MIFFLVLLTNWYSDKVEAKTLAYNTERSGSKKYTKTERCKQNKVKGIISDK
jgi:hypothetical protein